MKHRKKKDTKLLKWCSYFFLSLLVLLLSLSLYKLFTNCIWDGNSRFTLVVHNVSKRDWQLPSIAIISIEPRQSRASYFSVPNRALLDVPYGYNTYIAGSIYRLGELDKKRNGGELLAKSIETTFGIAVDAYLVIDDSSFLLLPDSYKEIKRLKWPLFPILGVAIPFEVKSGRLKVVRTNLSGPDRYLLWSKLRKLRSDQINYIDLGETNAMADSTLPDGTLVKSVDKDLADVVIDGYFEDFRVRGENISLEVVNAANFEGLASNFGRILTHMGANVIKRSTEENVESEACLLYLSQKKITESLIIKRLKKLYNCYVSEVSTGIGQADVKIVLGEEFVR